MASSSDALNALHSVQASFRGPGGALAVIRDGEEVARLVYGLADMDRRIPFTSQTLSPICSISKQMVCLVLADLVRNPPPAAKKPGDVLSQLEADLKVMLPQLADHKDGPLTVAHLYNMQSGIRDYWAMSVLWGARPEDPFSYTADGPKALERIKSFHFPPGTEYSYSNVNFHILGRLLERLSGQSLGQLLAERVFKPAGMSTAALCPNTFGLPLPIVGYEGDEKERGYIPAVNKIEWYGDAGIVASLDDMIAYEKWLESQWNDSQSIYRDIAEPPRYKDGTPAKYGHGLAHGEVAEKAETSHGGALRGYRLYRAHVPSEHLSVVVLFNHEADSGAAADKILKSVLGWENDTEKAVVSPAAEWAGVFLDVETQLRIEVELETDGKLGITYGTRKEKIGLTDPTHAESKTMLASIEGNKLHIQRHIDNRTINAIRIVQDAEADASKILSEDFTGEFHCADIESTLTCTGNGSVLYGFFDGYLGKGPAHLMRYIGGDVWLLACPRGMDAAAPGDWTIVFHRGNDGKVTGATVGCWLARQLRYVKKL